MFFCDKNSINEIELFINEIKNNYELFNIEEIYNIISNYYPYSGIVIINDIEYLCINDNLYDIDGKAYVINIYKDDILNKNNIKHL